MRNHALEFHFSRLHCGLYNLPGCWGRTVVRFVYHFVKRRGVNYRSLIKINKFNSVVCFTRGS